MLYFVYDLCNKEIYVTVQHNRSDAEFYVHALSVVPSMTISSWYGHVCGCAQQAWHFLLSVGFHR